MDKGLRDIALEDSQVLKAFSNIKIIAVDLDGTMSGSADMEIWENILWFVRNINIRSSKKTSLIIATGRTLTGAKRAIELLYQNKTLPIILYNGSLVIRNSTWEILYKRTIPRHTLKTIVEMVEIFPINIYSYCFMGTNKNPFDPNDQLEYVLGFGSNRERKTEFNKMPIMWEFEEQHLENEASAVLIDIQNVKPQGVDQIFKKLSEINGISITSSGFAYIEIRPENSNKALALSFLAKDMNLKNSDFAAIGDNNNDVEMLKWAGIGVAVSNGTPMALDAAKYISSHNVAAGVVEVLRLIKQSKRYHNE